MAAIKTLLVDDEYLALNLLEKFTDRVPGLEVVEKVKSPMRALDILHQTPIDLLFLDIQMPTLSGNNLLKTLKNPPLTIFTTAYSDYAIEAFELNAVDYLLKPFSFERFLKAVNKAKDHLQLPPLPPAIEAPTISKDFFSIKVDGKIMKVHFEDILYIEGLKEYVRVVCRDVRLVTLARLKNMEDLLPADKFVRVHKSYIVAKSKVQALEGNMLDISKHKIPISRSKRDEILEWIFYK